MTHDAQVLVLSGFKDAALQKQVLLLLQCKRGHLCGHMLHDACLMNTLASMRVLTMRTCHDITIDSVLMT